MKTGFRTPSPKRSFSARTTGKINRTVKKSINPLYGKKDMGYINNPEKAVYNKAYNKTTIGANQVFNASSSVSNKDFDAQTALTRIKQLNETVSIINNTTNVSTFFSRYEFALQICDELANYEYTGVIKTITPMQQKRELLEQMPSVINSLIVRSYNKAYAKAQELKTENGRHNRIIHFFDILIEELNQYGAKYITETNISKIHELLSKLNMDNEVTVNLTPITITLPSVSAPSVNTQQSDYPHNVNNYETCDYTTNDVAEEKSNGVGFDIAVAAALYCIFIPLIGIMLCIIGLNGIGIFAFVIYAIIILICYCIGENS